MSTNTILRRLKSSPRLMKDQKQKTERSDSPHLEKTKKLKTGLNRVFCLELAHESPFRTRKIVYHAWVEVSSS